MKKPYVDYVEASGAQLYKHIIQEFICGRLHSYAVNLDYYDGKHRVLDREDKILINQDGEEVQKESAKLVFQFPKLIVDTANNYLLGKPVTYKNKKSCKHNDKANTDEFIDILNDIFEDNNEHYQTCELGKALSITGDAYEYVHIGMDGEIKFTSFPADECIPIYEASTKELESLIRFYQMERIDEDGNKEMFYKVEIYDREKVEYYEYVNNYFMLDATKETFYHKLGEVPVVHYKNSTVIGSDYGKSDIDDVITLIDEYENKLSDLSDILKYNANPLMMFENCIIDSTQYQEALASGTLFVPEGGKVSYLTWEQNIPALKEHIEKVEDAIFTFSFTPKLYRDNSDGNPSSGISIKMKFSGADLKASGKEINIKVGLKKRIRLIAKLLKLTEGVEYNYKDVDIVFNRSIPQNLLEIAQICTYLKGLVSDETLMETIPFITSIETEKDRVAKQKEQEVTKDTNEVTVGTKKVTNTSTDVPKQLGNPEMNR